MKHLHRLARHIVVVDQQAQAAPAAAAGATSVRPCLDSTDQFKNTVELRKRLQRDGYLFLRGVLPREAVLRVRRQALEIAASLGWVASGHPLEEAVANPAASTIDPDPSYLAMLSRLYRSEDLHALQHHPRVTDLFKRLLGGAVLPRPRLIPRCIFPNCPELTTSAHQDYPYVQGTEEVYTMWTPLGDCPFEMGPLQVAESSHLEGVRDFKITANAAAGLTVIDPLDGAWVTNDFLAGDALIFHSLTVHKGVPNHSSVLRQSVDFRFQRLSQPITPTSCEPFVTSLSWEEIYAEWSSKRLQYYWKAGANYKEYDMVSAQVRSGVYGIPTCVCVTRRAVLQIYFEQRDAQAFSLAESGDATARWTLLRIMQNDCSEAKRNRAAELIAHLDAAASK